jgi:putative DNA-invertase from lambdoid prophage Rac
MGVSLSLLDLGGDVTGNGISKLFLTIMSAVAEAERDRIRERITTVKRDQKAQKRFLGGLVPFGFVKQGDGILAADPAMQEHIATARRLRSDGKSLRAIRDVLASNGCRVSVDALHRTLKTPGQV